jgi:ATP-binding cassette subfamily C protein CydC
MITIKKLLVFIWPQRYQVLLSVLLSALTIGASISLMSTSAFLISMAALQPSVSVVGVAVVGVRFFGITRGIFRYFERIVSHSTSFKVLANIRVWLYTVIEPKAPAGISNFKTGDLLNRIMADVDNLENFFVRVFLPPATSLIVVFSVSAFMGLFSPRISIILFSGLLFIGLIISVFTLLFSREPGNQLTNIRSQLREEIVDFVQGLPDIQSFGQEEKFIDRIHTTSDQFYKIQQKLGLINATQSALTTLSMGLIIWFILYVTIPLVNSGTIEGVHLAVVILGSMASFEAVQNLPQAMNLLGANLRSANRLFELESVPAGIIEPSDPETPPTEANLVFKDLYFNYGEVEVIKGIDLNLPSGKKIAIVGKSGAGKTTLTNLLLRFWEPESGQILINGKDISCYRSEDLRKLISLVSQSTYLFNTSIRENLRLAYPKASEADMLNACKIAEIDAFIDSLPKKLDTVIGERGHQMSGGERQRLAIARAVLKNTPILILDEPTSNLDPVTEKKIITTIDRIARSKTVIWITHSLTGLEKMDEILVMEEGTIVERGTHEQLIEAKGEYFLMRNDQKF